ncbi:MAG TPA: VanZ family protein [Thermodesulfobacteriota bacterium]
MRKHLWGWAPLALYAGLILLVSLEPSPAGLSGGWDKLYHGLAYLGLAFLLMRALFVSGASRGLAAAAAAFMAAAAYGGIIEFLQSLTETRTGELMDGLANGTGAAIGALLYLFLNSKRG